MSNACTTYDAIPSCPSPAFFTAHLTLGDDSAIEMAEVAINGGFQKLKDLSFSINHKATEEEYRNLFQTMHNLSNLLEVTISRHFKEGIKAQATQSSL